mmetsp:Transcript_43091/g.55359  ORF Transcript_43091/g.55359 Transcript_43091/m.55359 type:complete len:86 (+) Transcript_43091:1091-1348(+)
MVVEEEDVGEGLQLVGEVIGKLKGVLWLKGVEGGHVVDHYGGHGEQRSSQICSVIHYEKTRLSTMSGLRDRQLIFVNLNQQRNKR